MVPIEKFLDFMRDKGCAPQNPSEIKADGAWNDYQIEGDANGKKKGFYTLKIDGDYVSGACGDRRSGDVHQYKGRPEKPLTDEQRREWAKRREADRKAREAQEKAEQEAVAAKCRKRWAEAKSGPHEYLTRKQINGEGSRVDGKFLLIPMYADNKLWSVQSIDIEGVKLFPKGGRKKACFCPLAHKDDDKSLIYICEGYATGASIRMATGSIVVVAFDAGNIKPVANAMRLKYPDAVIVIAGDNDVSGVGQKAAKEAAEAIKGEWVVPAEEGMDFNDVHVKLGLNSVSTMLADRQGVISPDVVVTDDHDALPPLYAYENEFQTLERRTVEDWRSLLITNGEGKLIKSSLKNMMLFLQHHDDYAGVFKMNDFQKEIFVTTCPKWDAPETFKIHRLEDNDISQTAASLERYGIAPSTEAVFKAIQVVAENNKFHPAREYFNNLEWDGTERLKNWLVYYLGAEGDSLEYLQFIGKKWMAAAVKRVFEPGCKFDHILTMEGKQGAGKSTAFEALATFGKDREETYFTDNIKLSDIQNKDTILLLQGSIIVELAELAGFRKQDDDEIKGWITTKEDRCRKPYGKTVTHFPRQFVLCGTTNNHDYLKDPTGNRRYWPFKSEAIDLQALKRDRVQLWAEAVHLYKSGYYIGPTPEEALMAEKAQHKRRAYDAWEDDVMGAVDGLGWDKQQAGFVIKAIMKEMGLRLNEQDEKNTRRIAKILKQNGYGSEVRRVDGRLKRVWVKEEQAEYD